MASKTYYSLRKRASILRGDLMTTGPNVGGKQTTKMVPVAAIEFNNGKYETADPVVQKMIEGNKEFGKVLGKDGCCFSTTAPLDDKAAKKAAEEANIEAEVQKRLAEKLKAAPKTTAKGK